MKEIKCPRCGRTTVFAPENQFRPFCSERCKLIDLGDWASGKYAIPVENPTPDDLRELDEQLSSAELNESPSEPDEQH